MRNVLNMLMLLFLEIHIYGKKMEISLFNEQTHWNM